MASLFDPLGFIAPLTIRLRKVLQAAWNHGPKWDKPLLLDNIQDFSSLREEIPAFKDIEIPRNYFLDKTISSIELHTFTDASEYALSAVSYMRIEYSDRSISVKFVMGKARVAPIKRMTIPNLELQAAVYGAQLAQFIKEEQDIEYSDCVFWSDSTTVLYWLRTPEMRHRIFVANRIAKILDVSSAFDWKYVSSKANPADDGTRGYSVEQMTSKSRWISGPPFLSQKRSEWPKQEILHAQQVKVVSFSSVNSTVSNIVDATKFSSWNKIIRVIAVCILFADKCRKRNAEMKLAHYIRAYLHVMHNIQEQDFQSEYMLLKKRPEVSGTSRLKALSPFLDENNLIRARGRLTKASLLMTARHPIILDGNNAAVKLLIQRTHEVNCHCGPEQTRNTLMEYYWILRCRAVVK